MSTIEQDWEALTQAALGPGPHGRLLLDLRDRVEKLEAISLGRPAEAVLEEYADMKADLQHASSENEAMAKQLAEAIRERDEARVEVAKALEKGCEELDEDRDNWERFANDILADVLGHPFEWSSAAGWHAAREAVRERMAEQLAAAREQGREEARRGIAEALEKYLNAQREIRDSKDNHYLASAEAAAKAIALYVAADIARNWQPAKGGES